MASCSALLGCSIATSTTIYGDSWGKFSDPEEYPSNLWLGASQSSHLECGAAGRFSFVPHFSTQVTASIEAFSASAVFGGCVQDCPIMFSHLCIFLLLQPTRQIVILPRMAMFKQLVSIMNLAIYSKDTIQLNTGLFISWGKWI